MKTLYNIFTPDSDIVFIFQLDTPLSHFYNRRQKFSYELLQSLYFNKFRLNCSFMDYVDYLTTEIRGFDSE